MEATLGPTVGIETVLQQFVDALFVKIEAQYAHRPLILAVLSKIQAEVDAALPQLLTQELPLIVNAITSIVDAEFVKLEKDVAAIPFLPELLKALNAWIDAEIGKLAQQAAKV